MAAAAQARLHPVIVSDGLLTVEDDGCGMDMTTRGAEFGSNGMKSEWS